MTPVLVRMSGNMIEVSGYTDALKDAMESELQYFAKFHLRGREAYDFEGHYRPVRSELRLLYRYDKFNRLLAPIGMTHRVVKMCQELGLPLTLQDVTDGKPDPGVYEPCWDNVYSRMELRHGQEDYLLAIASNDRGIIKCPPGFGKSYMFSAIGLLFPRATMHVVVKPVEVANTLYENMHKFLPSVGQVGGGRSLTGRRVTIFTADSLHRSDGKCDILLCDEGHELVARSYATELIRYTTSRNYTVTATPEGRGDNADMELEAMFGPIIYQMPYTEAATHKIVSPIEIRWNDVFMDINPCMNLRDTAKKRYGIWQNEYRNSRIAAAANKYPDQQVLTIVETVEHALYLKRELPDFTLVYGNASADQLQRFERNGLLPTNAPRMDWKYRTQLRHAFEAGDLRKVIATGVWNTGVSFNQLEVVVRADGSRSKILATQIPGRTSRLADDKSTGIVEDFIDQFDFGFHGKAVERRRQYTNEGWKQIYPTGRWASSEPTHAASRNT